MKSQRLIQLVTATIVTLERIANNWILSRLQARTRSPVTLHLLQVQESFVS